MDKIYTLQQDNGFCNEHGGKIRVQIPESALVHELRKFFRWRKDVTASRLYKQGSYNYDRFIKYLSQKGYKVIN